MVGSAADQLNIGRAYEAAGRFVDAEAAYRKALEIGSPRTRADALAALAKVVRLRADNLLSLAKSLEDQGRSSDAEAAYLEVLKAGDPLSRPAALDALARLSAPKDSGSVAVVLDAAKVLEEAGQWEESEALYRQALQTGSPAQRQTALAKIKEIAAIRGSFREKQLSPTWDASLRALVMAVLLIALVVLVVAPLSQILKWFFRRLQRDRLSIGDFGGAAKERLPGATFRETLTLMHERMSTHFRQRAIVGDAGKMPVLLGSFSSDVLDLIVDVDESLVPFRKWFSKVTHQPGYKISGWTEATWWNIKVCAKLEHSGKAIRQWTKTYPLYQWFAWEQDLAYEVLISLKEYANAPGA
jgi:tetratricopeptide (TPR) repeat protein